MVLLHTWLAPQASGDWHSSKSAKVAKKIKHEIELGKLQFNNPYLKIEK